MRELQADTDGRRPDDYDRRPILSKGARWMMRDCTTADTGCQPEGDGEMQTCRKAVSERLLVVSEGECRLSCVGGGSTDEAHDTGRENNEDV